MNKKIIGNEGEQLATNYLKKLGYKILERNFTMKGAEIDIIAMDKKTIVFVEVKSRANLDFGYPSEAVTKEKQHKIAMAAQFYMVKNRKCDIDARFDVIEVLNGEINHIINAFLLN